MPNTIVLFLIKSTYFFCPSVFGFSGLPFTVMQMKSSYIFSSSRRSVSSAEEMKYSRFCSVISSPFFTRATREWRIFQALWTSFSSPEIFTSSPRLTMLTPHAFSIFLIFASNCPNTGRMIWFSICMVLSKLIRVFLLLFFVLIFCFYVLLFLLYSFRHGNFRICADTVGVNLISDLYILYCTVRRQ